MAVFPEECDSGSSIRRKRRREGRVEDVRGKYKKSLPVPDWLSGVSDLLTAYMG